MPTLPVSPDPELATPYTTACFRQSGAFSGLIRRGSYYVIVHCPCQGAWLVNSSSRSVVVGIAGGVLDVGGVVDLQRELAVSADAKLEVNVRGIPDRVGDVVDVSRGVFESRVWDDGDLVGERCHCQKV